MTRQYKSYVFALLAVFCWSTVATAFKIALRSMDFFQLLLWANFSAVLVLFIILIFQQKLKLFLRTSAKDVFYSVFLGLLNPFAYYIILFKAYSLLPAQIAQPLNYTWPIVLVVLSVIFLKQKFRLKSMLAILISFCGVVVISFQGAFSFDFSSPGGIALAMGSSLLWATFWIFNTRDKRDDVVKLFSYFLCSVVPSLIAVILFSDLEIPATAAGIAAIYIGLFEMGITFVLWISALRLTSTADKISSLVYFSPFLSLFFIYFILGETIYYSTIAGLILIVAGIVIQKSKY